MTHRARYIDVTRPGAEGRNACWSQLAESPEPARAFRAVLRAAWRGGETGYAARRRSPRPRHLHR